MIGIVDYNAGNITSVEHALSSLKAEFILSKNPSDLEKCDRLIFPGVGDADYAMKQLKLTGFDTFLKDWAKADKPLIGICLGSQIIFDFSEEGNVECLGLLEGKIRHFDNVWKERHPDEKEHEQMAMLYNTLKIPHMGWNDITYCNGSSRLLEGVPEGSDFYFVHSYIIQPKDPTIIKAYTDYGTMVPAVVEKGNIAAFQFHPEKSGKWGMQILKNFINIDYSKNAGGNK